MSVSQIWDWVRVPAAWSPSGAAPKHHHECAVSQVGTDLDMIRNDVFYVGGFVLLYSCFFTVREWYRSQHCDIGGITTTHYWSGEVWSGASQLWDNPSREVGVGVDLWQCELTAILLCCIRPPATGSITCYPTQSHYPAMEWTSPCPILIMPSTRLASNK